MDDVSHEDAKLNEFDREEWWDVACALRPEMTRDEFDAHWDEFQRLKSERVRINSLN